MAHVCSGPTLRWLKTAPAGVSTRTGVLRSIVVPSPSKPIRSFCPQQYRAPAASMAQVRKRSASTATKTNPGAFTRTGASLGSVVPFPSPPYGFSPQQYADPVEVKAQLCPPPALIDVNVTPGGVVTITGVVGVAVVPSPSCPVTFNPQQ